MIELTNFEKDYYARMGIQINDVDKEVLDILIKLRDGFPEHTAPNGIWNERHQLVRTGIKLLKEKLKR